jgi:hypothetical protein
MTQAGTLEQTLAELVSATETLLGQLRRRDPAYLEALHCRQMLLERLQTLCPNIEASPPARAVLERLRLLGEACQTEAESMRAEIAAALAELHHHASYAESLQRITHPAGPSLLDVKA